MSGLKVQMPVGGLAGSIRDRSKVSATITSVRQKDGAVECSARWIADGRRDVGGFGSVLSDEKESKLSRKGALTTLEDVAASLLG